jgi:hypothetical protein
MDARDNSLEAAMPRAQCRVRQAPCCPTIAQPSSHAAGNILFHKIKSDVQLWVLLGWVEAVYQFTFSEGVGTVTQHEQVNSQAHGLSGCYIILHMTRMTSSK